MKGPYYSTAIARIHAHTYLGLLALALTLAPLRATPPVNSKEFKASDLFQTTNLWTVHLRFEPDQWTAMEPEGGASFGGPGGGPGGGRRGPGGPGGFGPGMFLAPSFLKEGDANRDNQLSKDEFQSLATKWFTAWDKSGSGKLNGDQIRDGLNASAAPPAFGPPGPGGPGGPGGRGPGMFLQGAEGKRNGLASALGIEFKEVHADLEFAGTPFTNVSVRYKGNGTFLQSRASLKRSLKIDLNEFVKGRSLGGVTKLNLHNCVTDASWMNEVLSHRLFRDAGVPAPRTAYARVYVTVPGQFDRQYFGLYSLVENVDGQFATANFGTPKGAIFKPVTPAPFTDLGDDWAKYKQTYDPKTDLTPAQKQHLIDFCKLVSHADDATFATRLAEFLDLDEFARFMAITTWLSTMDSILGPGQNYYVYLHPETRKLQFIPWDLDHSFGQFGMIGSQQQREQLSLRKPWRGENRFLERVYQVEAFQKVYRARFEELARTVLLPERFQQQVDQVAAAIRPAVQEESTDALGRFDKVVAGEPVPPAGFGGPGRGPGGPGMGFFQPPKPIKGFATARAASVKDQLAGKAEGEVIADFGFGGPGGPGGPGGRGGGPGRPGFGPGMFVGPTFLAALDADKNQTVDRDEFSRGFARWFEAWKGPQGETLSEEQLRNGINRDLAPAGPPGGPPAGDR